jgi:hypothetical protein
MRKQLTPKVLILALLLVGAIGGGHNAVVIDEMVAPLKNKVVILEGTAEVQTSGVKEITSKIYHKYMGTEGAATPVAQQSINAPRVILKITPKKVESMDTTH